MEIGLVSEQRPDRGHGGLAVRLAGEERLARLVAHGRKDAFEALYARYHQQLFRYCRSIVGTDADAQDALQTALGRAYVALAEGRRDAPVRPWLYRIVHNEALSLIRRRRPEVELPEALPMSARSAHEAAEERAALSALLEDLAELPERQRGALVMRELSGLGHEDIAAAFDISVGAAKQTIFEARRALQEFAEGRAMECEVVQRVVSDGDRRTLRGRRVRAHLRDCASCAAFAHAIPERGAHLRALAPGLPLAAAVGLLGRITGGGVATGGGAASGTASGGLGGSAGGLAGTLPGGAGSGFGVIVSGKALATGVAVLATALVGAGVVRHVESSSGHQTPQLVAPAAGGVAPSRGAAVRAKGAAAHPTASLAPATRDRTGDEGVSSRPVAGHTATTLQRRPAKHHPWRSAVPKATASSPQPTSTGGRAGGQGVGGGAATSGQRIARGHSSKGPGAAQHPASSPAGRGATRAGSRSTGLRTAARGGSGAPAAHGSANALTVPARPSGLPRSTTSGTAATPSPRSRGASVPATGPDAPGAPNGQILNPRG